MSLILSEFAHPRLPDPSVPGVPPQEDPEEEEEEEEEDEEQDEEPATHDGYSE